MKTNIIASCSRCGEKREVPFYGGINVAEEPELKARVKDGSLFLWECPHCGSTNLLTGQTIYHDPEERLMIWLLPEGSLPEESVRAVESSLIEAAETLEGYIFRRVESVGSLIEKVNIHDAGLEDTVIEMCKYITRMEMSQNGSRPFTDAPLKFFSMDGPDNELTFTYPEKGQMQGIRIGFNVYEDCAGILRRNPSVKPSGGFPRIDQDWISRFFR